MLILTKGSPQEKMKFSFNLFDFQNTGRICKDIFIYVLLNIYKDKPQVMKKVEILFNAIDWNKDDFIDLEDFETIKDKPDIANLFGLDFRENSRKLPIIGTFSIEKTYRDILIHLITGIRWICSKELKEKSPVTATSEKFQGIDEEFMIMDAKQLAPEDFEGVKRIAIKDVGNPSESWKFEAYAPAVFEAIRSAFNLQAKDYISSLSQDSLIRGLLSGNWKFFESLENSGRSGSMIFKSHDNFLFIKSLPDSEAKHLLNILKDFYDYVITNKDTLLTRFYGLYTITPPPSMNVLPITFIIMENCLNSPLCIHQSYDLKGSKVNRSTPIDKRAVGVALKDVDFDQDKRQIRIDPLMKKQLYKQIESDTTFLASKNILDYSLLLGISYKFQDQHITTNQEEKKSYISKFQKDFGGTKGEKGLHFFFGIIDILTQWDYSKISENKMKTLILQQDSTQISAVEPPLYHKRFMDYMSQILTD
uniref:PIPK domain-containing protein n=1 Tax=Arcella intermedia TaxID=1963864 RepID=A0A6B2L1Z5_9EUKA